MIGLCMRPLPPLLLAAALLAACGTQVVNPVTGQTERTVMDEQTEIAEGAKAHKEVLQEYRPYDSPKLQAYVDDLGQRLAKQSHRAGLTWTFTVLDSPEINAFALPGGYVYVTRGIMAFLDSEAELAGVMGHEIGHVTARHGAQRATRRQSAGIGVIAATVLGAVLEVGGLSGATNIASQLSQGAAAGYVASYSRDQESQADELGAEYLARNHYDPRNMIDVIQALKSQEQFAVDNAKAEGKPAPSGSNWLSSHPANDKRLADIKAFADEVPGTGRVRRRRARALPPGDRGNDLRRQRRTGARARPQLLSPRPRHRSDGAAGLADPERSGDDRGRQRRRRRGPDRAGGCPRKPAARTTK